MSNTGGLWSKLGLGSGKRDDEYRIARRARPDMLQTSYSHSLKAL